MKDQQLIGSYRAETQAKLRQVDELSDSDHPRVFHVTQCAACSAQLDLPSVHFMCNHSYHQRFVPCFFRATFQPADVVDRSRGLAAWANTRRSAPIVRVHTASSRKSGGTMRGSQISTTSSSRKSGKAGSLRSRLVLDVARSTLRCLRTSVRRLSSSRRSCIRYISRSSVDTILGLPKDIGGTIGA